MHGAHDGAPDTLSARDYGGVIGMVSIGDLIKNLITEQEHTIRQLEHYIHGNSFHVGHNGLQAQQPRV